MIINTETTSQMNCFNLIFIFQTNKIITSNNELDAQWS